MQYTDADNPEIFIEAKDGRVHYRITANDKVILTMDFPPESADQLALLSIRGAHVARGQ